MFGLFASHSIQRKTLTHFSIAARPLGDRLCSGNCLSQLQKRTHDENRNGGERWHGTALSRCRSCQMSREESDIFQTQNGRNTCIPPSLQVKIFPSGTILLRNAGRNLSAILHHNKTKKNLHIHLIFLERRLLPEPDIKIATRSVFYDEAGKRVRTKKESFFILFCFHAVFVESVHPSPL